MYPDFVNALAGLAATYMATGRYEDAISKLERAIRKEPKMPYLHLELGKAYEAAGNVRRAREEYQLAAEMGQELPIGDEARKAFEEAALIG